MSAKLSYHGLWRWLQLQRWRIANYVFGQKLKQNTDGKHQILWEHQSIILTKCKHVDLQMKPMVSEL